MLQPRALLSSMLALSLVVTPLAPAMAAGTGLSKAEYEACQTRDESAFRATVETITQDALRKSLETFDTKAAVADAWRSNGMNETVDKRVDIAVDEIIRETSWVERWSTLANSEKAQALAKNVAERVYRSDPVKTAFEAIGGDVARKLGTSMEFASQDAVAPAIACVKAFLGNRYGAAVSTAVSDKAENEFGVENKGRADVNAGTVIKNSGQGITGAAILLVRRQLANMAQRVGQRIVGSVLSRVVSVAAGGVGAVLIAKDLWDLRHGALPIIANEMKSNTTKSQVQDELARSIAEQINEHVREIATRSAQHIIDIWQDFRRAHAKTMEFAERNERFRTFLDLTKPTNLPRLDEVVGITLSSEGEDGLTKRLADGTLDTAVNALPPEAMEIARETRSIDKGLKWATLAGGDLPKVVELELYRQANPDDYTRTSLTQLLALEDKIAITRMGQLPRDVRQILFELNSADLKLLARALQGDELTTLAGYMTGLERTPRERILRAIALHPSKLRVLASARVRDAVLASRNQASAVDMMLNADVPTPQSIFADVKLAFDGAVSPLLLWERHPAVVISGLIPLFVVLMLLRRIFVPRRKSKPVTSAATASQ